MKSVIAIYLVIALVIFYGWALNIISLIDAPAVYLWGGLEVARVIGVIFPPIGAVLGFFF